MILRRPARPILDVLRGGARERRDGGEATGSEFSQPAEAVCVLPQQMQDRFHCLHRNAAVLTIFARRNTAYQAFVEKALYASILKFCRRFDIADELT